MKTLIVKGDKTPVKSRVHAVRILNELGIAKDELIEENGSFYYETVEPKEEKVEVEQPKAKKINLPKEIAWDIPVYPDGINNLKMNFKGSDVEATLIAKHPAGQNFIRPYAAFELHIGEEKFVMSLELCQKLLEIKGV